MLERRSSTILAAVGLGTTALTLHRRQASALWMPLGYFSLMEALQAYTYAVIDGCSNPGNQIATLLGDLHIAFQPFFINLMAMHFIPDPVRRRIEIPVYALCFASIVMLIQLYPFDWAGSCAAGRPLCGARLCSVSGTWHLAWEVPANGLGNVFQRMDLPLEGLASGYPTHIFRALLLPLIYGSWRFAVYHYVMGPTLASLTTSNIDEWPAIWCLLSIGLLLIVVKTRLRRWLRVEGPFWWPASWSDQNPLRQSQLV